jgi:hypothetical protein
MARENRRNVKKYGTKQGLPQEDFAKKSNASYCLN